MYKVINVVFTTRKMNALEVAKMTKYAFICNIPVKEGDLLVSPMYTTPMMVTDTYMSESNLLNGRIPLKELVVDKINGKSILSKTNNNLNNQVMTPNKGNGMFSGIVDKYKSQFIPQREEGVRMSLNGLICVPVDNEYVGMDDQGKLMSFPLEMTIDIPVYSINKPNSKVNVGDIIKSARSYSKVLGKNEDGSLKILSFSGYTHNKKEVTDFLMGQATTRVLINMFNFDDSTGFNPLFFAFAQGDTIDVNSLMMLSMTPQGKDLFSNAGGSFNPMMLMMLDKNHQGGNMMETMCMMNMMGGGNMFGNMFGNAAPKQETAKPVTEDDEMARLDRQIEIEKKKAQLAELIKSNTADCPASC